MRKFLRQLGKCAARHLLPLTVIGAALTAASPAAQAQAPTTGFATNFGSNADKPIDIQADMLEVDDKKKIATFKGNVTATQGDFNMKSHELVVNYTTGNSNAKDAAKSSLPGGARGEINTINAKGEIIITSAKDNQQATGDAALFEVKKQMVYLNGNVRVKQGKNIVAGETLAIDLTKGTATFTPRDGGPAVKNRIQMVIQPEEKNKATAKETVDETRAGSAQ